MRGDLETYGELERFEKIEQPASHIFHHRQHAGIPIASKDIDEFFDQASATKYKAYQEVAKILDVSPTGLTYWNIGSLLAGTDLGDIAATVSGYSANF